MPAVPTVIPVTAERGVGNPDFSRNPPIHVITIATPRTDGLPCQLQFGKSGMQFRQRR
jgi:hypothetical protein